VDFTLTAYKNLLLALKEQGYTFKTFLAFNDVAAEKYAIMRHDVDKLPQNALKMAQLEKEQGVAASYYFRAIPGVFDKEIIKKIAALGHEIGYHYEDLAMAKGDKEKAIEKFKHNLQAFREIYPVKTICMHGSPLSRIDNREIWSAYNYRDYGIQFEPYYDVDYTDVYYLTDTGRKWNNQSANVRDRLLATSGKTLLNDRIDPGIRSTQDIISASKAGTLPQKIIINTHPQRWFEPGFGWARELVLQNVKNVIKSALKKLRGDGVTR